MLDIKQLIIGSSFILIILAITSLFFMLKYPKVRYIRFFLSFSILFFVGLLLLSARNTIPDFLSIIMGKKKKNSACKNFFSVLGRKNSFL